MIFNIVNNRRFADCVMMCPGHSSGFSFVYSPDLRQQTTDPSTRLSSNVSSVDTTQSPLDGVGYGDNNTDGKHISVLHIPSSPYLFYLSALDF